MFTVPIRRNNLFTGLAAIFTLLCSQPVMAVTMQDLLTQAENAYSITSSDPGRGEWKVESGKKVREILYLWTKKAGWTLVWHPDYDLELSAPAQFEGDMTAAVKQLFASINTAEAPLFAQLYPENKVLVVNSSIDD